MSENCTIVVASNDENEDLWDPFFLLLKRNWSNVKYPIVLATRSKKYKYKGLDIKTYGLYNPWDDIPWSKRLKDHLKRIKTEYVIFLLDDHFCYGSVDQKRIDECVRWMDMNKGISVFYFENNVRGDDRDKKEKNMYKGFYKKKARCNYKVCTAPAIWRRKHLISVLRDRESPWDFEHFGSIRAIRHFKKYYVLEKGERTIYPAFGYTNNYKYNIHHGKWPPAICGLFERYNMEMDYSVRGFYEYGDDSQTVYSVRKNFPKDLMTIIWWKEILKRIQLCGKYFIAFW